MFPGRHGGGDVIAGEATRGLTAEESVFGLANLGLSTQRAAINFGLDYNPQIGIHF